MSYVQLQLSLAVLKSYSKEVHNILTVVENKYSKSSVHNKRVEFQLGWDKDDLEPILFLNNKIKAGLINFPARPDSIPQCISKCKIISI